MQYSWILCLLSPHLFTLKHLCLPLSSNANKCIPISTSSYSSLTSYNAGASVVAVVDIVSNDTSLIIPSQLARRRFKHKSLHKTERIFVPHLQSWAQNRSARASDVNIIRRNEYEYGKCCGIEQSLLLPVLQPWCRCRCTWHRWAPDNSTHHSTPIECLAVALIFFHRRWNLTLSANFHLLPCPSHPCLQGNPCTSSSSHIARAPCNKDSSRRMKNACLTCG